MHRFSAQGIDGSEGSDKDIFHCFKPLNRLLATVGWSVAGVPGSTRRMLPFETPSVFDQLPRYLLKIPRVVKDQKHKFETEDLFKKLSREGEVSRSGEILSE